MTLEGNETLKNYMEDVARELLEEIKGLHPDLCFCERCVRDIIALTLSRIKGKYAVTPEGEIFARVEQSDRQVRADVLLAVMESLEIVSANPRH